ncbi:ABC transporter substrate-binding protein [Cytobacillus sp. IB215316]|uniref:ABC transporter substrate-binding protein n=1 Tax=Cytobacillus sp. IB215316 TaxID=3097354 RepID=UPI002A1611A2|nr:ABC transporter substrate-binding protein [Cytobacillus sp. IB215316]MDX8359775.1 ABC transporter substrate-binding protein [Cytobacillus sp. IB215316]
MKKYFPTVFIVILSFILLVGCGQTEVKNNEASTNVEQETKVDDKAESSFPVTITDGLGNDVTIEEEPQAIVSLIPSNTEIAFALGLGDKMVGVGDWADYPPEVADIARVGGTEFNVEKVISLNPDVVLAHASSAHSSTEGLQQLRDAGINVVVVNNATSFKAVYDSIKMIGVVTGTEENADKIISDMTEKLNLIKEKSAEIKEADQKVVWIEISQAPDLFTTGKGTFMHEMLEAIGAINAAGDQEGWPQFTEEDAVLLKPDVIVITYGYYVDNAVDQVLARDAWQEVPAVKNKLVFDINSNLVTRSGPRLIEGVEELAKAVYPDIYQ